MKLLLICLLLVGCNNAVPGEQVSGSEGAPVGYFHDDQHQVSCWIYGGTGNYGKSISCLPDKDVAR